MLVLLVTFLEVKFPSSAESKIFLSPGDSESIEISYSQLDNIMWDEYSENGNLGVVMLRVGSLENGEFRTDFVRSFDTSIESKHDDFRRVLNEVESSDRDYQLTFNLNLATQETYFVRG